MSFSLSVKEELSRQSSPARHCQIAEIAAIVSLCGRIGTGERGLPELKILTENVAVARKYFTLLKKAFNISLDVSIRQNSGGRGKSRLCSVGITRGEDALRVLQAVKLYGRQGRPAVDPVPAQNAMLMQSCCKRAFIRGAFLAAGSISDPEKFYHLEFACAREDRAGQIRTLILSFGLAAKVVRRKKYFVVYIKEGDHIVDLLNIMQAPRSLMELENIRILREMRGSVNRQVNCETANINKTVSAAVRQVDDILFIRDKIGLEALPDNLREIARLRLARPEATLKELGEALDPPVGKSGVNHRLRRLGETAEKLRGSEPGA